MFLFYSCIGAGTIRYASLKATDIYVRRSEAEATGISIPDKIDFIPSDDLFGIFIILLEMADKLSFSMNDDSRMLLEKKKTIGQDVALYFPTFFSRFFQEMRGSTFRVSKDL